MTHPAYGQLRPVTATASVVLVGNPGPMTLDGTNTWLLSASPGTAVVVDPGPDDPAHLSAVAAAAGRVELIVLSHHHPDHSAGVAALAAATGAPVRALDPALCSGAGQLTDGEVITAAGVEIRVWAVPGHTADSVALLISARGAAADAVLTADTVLGRGTTVIAEPDGDLGAYLDSLRRLATLTGVTVLPGHGPERPDCAEAAQQYLAHRAERLEQVRAALVELDVPPTDSAADAVLATVYADVDRSLWPAAAQSVRAQLRYLRECG